MNGLLALSLQAASWATLLTAVVGTGAAWLLARRSFPGRTLAEGVTVLPLVLPPTVLGYYLLVAFGVDSWPGRLFRALTGGDLVFSFPGIVLAAFVGSLPLYLRQAQTAFAGIDRELEDSARAFGASEWQVFRQVTLPLAQRGIAAGAALAFARALGDFGATLMVGGNIPGHTRTLALAVYDAWQAGDSAAASGMALMLAAIALAVSLAATRLAYER